MAVSILAASLFLVIGEPSQFARWQCQSERRNPARTEPRPTGPLTSHTPAVASTPVQPIGHLRRLLAAVGICEIESP